MSFLTYISYTVTTLISVLCYINSLDGDFVHDDISAIKNNPDVMPNTNIDELFRNDFWGRPMSDPNSHKSYRPITVLTFRLNVAADGLQPYGFHVVNVILHALVTFLLLNLTQILFGWQWLEMMMVGLLFAVHPIHTEAVAGIVGRADILACLLFIGAYVQYLRSMEFHITTIGTIPKTQNWQELSISLLFSGFAMLTKEHGITILGVMLCNELYIGWKAYRRKKKLLPWKMWLPIAQRVLLIISTSLLLLVFRMKILNNSLPQFSDQDNPASFSPHLKTRFLTYAYLTTFNFWLLLSPLTLSYDWQLGSIPLVENYNDFRNMWSILFYIMIVLIVWKILNQTEEEEEFVIFASFILLLVPFLPASNLFITVGFVVAERILYIPSLGFSILVVHGLRRITHHCKNSRKIIYAAFIILISIFTLRTVIRNKAWHSRESLFQSGLDGMPYNGKMHYNFANLQKDLNHTEVAIKHYQIALKLWPQHASAHNNLGTLVNNRSRAAYHFRKAIEINPRHLRAHYNLGSLLQTENPNQSIRLLERVLELDSTHKDASTLLARLYTDEGHLQHAEQIHQTLLTVYPKDADVYNEYGLFLQKYGRGNEALHYYQRAINLQSNHTMALVNAARLLRILHYTGQAEDLYQRALEIQEHPLVLNNLGILYLNTGRYSEAKNVFEKFLTKDPDNLEARVYYAQALIRQRNYKNAEDILLKIIDKNQSYREAIHQLANLYFHMNRTTEALHYILQILKNCSFDDLMCGQVYADYGSILRNLDDLDTAAESYKMAIQVNPNLSHAHLNLGVIYHLKQDFQHAWQHYRTAQLLEPHNQLLLDNMEKLRRTELRLAASLGNKEGSCS